MADSTEVGYPQVYPQGLKSARRRGNALPVSDEPLRLGPLLRALRHSADLSQRELAAKAGVAPATLARIESGATTDPRLRAVERLVAAAGGALHVVNVATGVPVTPGPGDDLRDEGDRHYPAHLDVRRVHSPKDWWGAWWAHWYDIPEPHWPVPVPDYTYDLRRWRDWRRGQKGGQEAASEDGG